jgi:hypothetical protein
MKLLSCSLDAVVDILSVLTFNDENRFTIEHK